MNQNVQVPPAPSARVHLPFGCHDLDPEVVRDQVHPGRVRCYINGCSHFVRSPRRHRTGEACPVHGIYCHSSSAGHTYTYADVKQNIIASPELFAKRIVGHPFKYESHRLGYERSEDAVSWNVWRSLDEAQLLSRIGQWITGIESRIQPRLYLWGLEITDDAFEPWSLLIAARDRFESNLPVDRPKTEPDIALHLPGKYLILIEAKFASPNTAYRRGPRKDSSSLTLDELIGIYQDPSLRILEVGKAEIAERVFYQLWRNTAFAEWMAKLDHPATQAFHVNLVRDGYEEETAAEFSELIHPGCKQRFRRITWEQIHQLYVHEPCLARMRQYLETKTAGTAAGIQTVEVCPMIRPQWRLGVVRNRVCDARQLVRCLQTEPLSPDSVRTHLQVRLAVALQALARLKTMPMLRGSSECEPLVDRVKALLELDVPILLLSSVAPKDRLHLGAEVLESLRFNETSGCSLNQLIAIDFPPAKGSSRFATGAFLDLVAWFDAVVAATIEADRAGEAAGQRGRWTEGDL